MADEPRTEVEHSRRRLLAAMAAFGAVGGAGCAGTQSESGSVTYAPTNPSVGDEVVFDASEIEKLDDPGGEPDTVDEYRWDFDNDGRFDSRGTSVSHIFEEPGQHVVLLSMVADCGGFSCGLGRQRDRERSITIPVAVSGESGSDGPADSDSGLEIDTDDVNVALKGTRTTVEPDGTAVVQFSAVNYVGNDALTVQLILEAPNDWSVTGVESVDSGLAQYSSTYRIEPGDTEGIRIRITPETPGRYELTGRVVYYFGEDGADRTVRRFVIPVTVETS